MKRPVLLVPCVMALRATSGPACSTRSVRVGEAVAFTAKIENTGAEPATIALAVEDLHEGAMRRPVDHAVAIEPPRVQVPAKSRKSVSFAWTASLPEGKEAFTFRGRVVLRRVEDGKTVGEAPLDLYVSAK